MNNEHSSGEYSVCQFFRDPAGTYEYVKRFVGAAEALDTAISLSKSVGARIGTTQRVVITDGGDCTNWEWQHGAGLVYPTREDFEDGSSHA